MGKLILVTGGARSGKSQFTEEQIWDRDKVCYIATGLTRHNDPEWEERVRLHKERRPMTWATHEQYDHLSNWLESQSYETYLLDCATMLTTNVLFDRVTAHYPEKIVLSDEDFLTKSEQAYITSLIDEEWARLIEVVKHIDANVYIVTNEIGLGIVPDTALGRYFRDILGKVNQKLAKEASEVYLVICGLSQRLK